MNQVEPGRRFDHLSDVAADLFRGGFSPHDVYQRLLTENEACCKPPLPMVDVARIVKVEYQRRNK